MQQSGILFRRRRAGLLLLQLLLQRGQAAVFQLGSAEMCIRDRPSMLAQFISVLYSIVDRIFIGQIPGEGALALAGAGEMCIRDRTRSMCATATSAS